MGLLAWYPLTEDAKDYSGNNNHGVNHGASLSSGKIGQAFNFDGSDYISLPNTNHIFGVESGSKIRELTLSCWAKQTRADRARLITLFNPSDASAFTIRVDGDDIDTFGHNSVVYLNGIEYSGGGIPVGEWFHITVTFSGGETDVGSFSGEIGRWRGGNQYWDGLINDVRIYDHTLSKKEIKDLAKAKVAHYTFDQFQEPTKNLIKNGDFMRSNSSWYLTGSSEIIKTSESLFGTKCGKINHTPETSTNSRIRATGIEIEEGFEYTVSVYVKKISGEEDAAIMFWGTNGFGFSTRTEKPSKGAWKRYSWTFTSTDSGSFAFQVYARTDEGEYIEALVDGYQLERKKYPTPFTVGYRQGFIFDSSGYENHASLDLDTSPKWISNSAIGSGAYEFFNYQHIEGQLGVIETFNGSDNPFSISLWTKVKQNHSPYDGIFSLYRSDNTYNGMTFNVTGDSSMRIRYWQDGGTSVNWSTDSPFNNWTHFVLVFSEKKVIIYENGKQVVEASYNNVFDLAKKFRIGCYEWQEDKLDGFVDDLQIYATPLTGSDANELYKSKASIDKEGNFISKGFSEEVKQVSFHKIPSGNSHNGSYGLRFTVSKSIILKSSVVKSYFSGVCFAELYNFDSGEKIQESSFFANEKNQEIDLNFYCEPGVNYWMTMSRGDFMRTNSGLEFPKEFGPFTFTPGSNLSGNTATRWYYFFGIKFVEDFGLSDSGIYKSSNFSETGVVKNLIAWYPLCMNSEDYTSNRANAINNGAVVVLGSSKGSHQFDGENSFLEVSKKIEISYDDISVGCWFKPYKGYGEGERSWLISKRSGNWSDFSLYARLRADEQGSSIGVSLNGDNYRAGTLNINDWNFVYFTYSSIDQKIKIFLNGQVIKSDDRQDSGLSFYDNLIIGKRGTHNDYYANGEIYDVRIYDRALTEQEIGILYKATSRIKDNKIQQSKNKVIYTASQFKEI